MSAVEALVPVFLLVLTGYALKRLGFPGKDFWEVGDRLTYYVLFPALLVSSMAEVSLVGSVVLPLTGAVGGAVLAMTGLLLALRRGLERLLRMDSPGFTSLVQGSIRPNTYVGLAAALALFGPQGVSLGTVALIVLIPLVNMISVGVLGRFGTTQGRGQAGLIPQIAKNPLILASLAGLLLSVIGNPLPNPVMQAMRFLGRAALPMGLLAVGAGLTFAGLLARWRANLAGCVLHLLLLPGLAFGLGSLFGADRQTLAVAVLFTAVPVSASSYILARILGGDHELMASLLTVETAAAMASIPVVLGLILP